MSSVEKIIDSLNLPKQILDKSEALLKALFGQSFDELGGMIADQVRLRRFKNQIKIFDKAQSILKDKKINPKQVSLKVLAPLIEYSSYEEEESLQGKWSNLIAHILEDNNNTVFQQNCITILNRISGEEAILIDFLHKKFNEKRIKRHADALKYHTDHNLKSTFTQKPENYPLQYFPFHINKISGELNKTKKELEFQISNLTVLGLLKWETDVEVEARKANEDPDDTDIDVDVNVSNNDNFIFSSLGVKFVEACSNK
jgi:hypothetical protein